MPAANTSRKPAATTQADWDAHLATLAHAHKNIIKLNSKLSIEWNEESSTRTKYTNRCQREANQAGQTWRVVDYRGSVLVQCEPQFAKVEETDEDDLLSIHI